MSSAALSRVRVLVEGWARDFAEDEDVRMGAVVDDLRSAITGPAPAAHERPLTLIQQGVLDAITTSMEKRGYPPTLREIGATVGLASVSSVSHQLQVLEARGVLTRDPNSPRAITIHSTPVGGDRV